MKNYVLIRELRNYALCGPSLAVPKSEFEKRFTPKSNDEGVFFKLVIPNYNANRWQLTGARVHLARIWDAKKGGFISVRNPMGVGTALDCIVTRESEDSAGHDVRKLLIGASRLDWESQMRLVQEALRSIGEVQGTFVRLDSDEIAEKLRQFDSGRNDYDRLRIWSADADGKKHYGEPCMLLPPGNIFGYRVPRNLVKRKFTPQLDTSWPPTKAFIYFIDGFTPPRSSESERIIRSSDLLTVTTIVKTVPPAITSREVRKIEGIYGRALEYRTMNNGTAALVDEIKFLSPER